MALDTSIYNALMAPQKSMMDYANDYEDRVAKREQRDMLRQQNALQLQSLQDANSERKRGLAEKNALADLYRQGEPDLSKPENRAKLYQVAPSMADGLIKTHGEITERAAKTAKENAEKLKADAETEQKALATTYMKRDRHLQALGGIQDLQSAAQWIQQGVQLGEFQPEQAQQIMGALQSGKMPLDQWKVNAQKGGMTIQQQTQDRMNQLELAVKQSTAAEQVRHNKASEGLTARGQNMADSRARENNDIQRQAGRTQVIETADGVMLVDKGTGLARPAATFNGQSLPGKQPEAVRSQVAGIDALGSAIKSYQDELKNWSASGALSPNARAKMGTAYNNMMLQAKEAYKLGVLNGNDYEILTSIVTDPTSMKGAITSNDSLMQQASDLDRMMQGTKSAITKSKPQPGAAKAPSVSNW